MAPKFVDIVQSIFKLIDRNRLTEPNGVAPVVDIQPNVAEIPVQPPDSSTPEIPANSNVDDSIQNADGGTSTDDTLREKQALEEAEKQRKLAEEEAKKQQEKAAEDQSKEGEGAPETPKETKEKPKGAEELPVGEFLRILLKCVLRSHSFEVTRQTNSNFFFSSSHDFLQLTWIDSSGHTNTY